MMQSILFFLFFSFSLVHAFQSQNSSLYTKNAFQVIDSFAKHNFDLSASYFSTRFPRKEMIASLKQTWTYQEKRFGPFQEVLYISTKKLKNMEQTNVLIQLQNKQLGLSFNFFSNGKIRSFQFIDIQKIQPPKYKTPPYVKSKKFTTESLELGGKISPLQTKIYLPKTQMIQETLIFLHDFGPQDLYHKTGVNSYYRDMAEGLASNSIASVLFNKRSYIYQAKNAAQFTPGWEVLRDLYGVLFKIKSHPRLKDSKITLILNGFSSYFASYLATQKVFDQFILLNPSFRHPLYTLFEKEEFFLRNELNSEENLLKLHSRIEHFFRDPKENKDSFFSYPSHYFKQLQNYQPSEIPKEIQASFLLLSAGEDYSSNPSDLPLFDQVLKNQKVKHHEFPELNHIFHVGKLLQTKENIHTQGIVSARVILIMKNWIEAQQ
ncbi:hypothetical protein MJH12_17775 [bacterium]|nr:hypothetical protein [bacterium]